MTERKYTPQEAYEEDCRRCPTYPDDTPRKAWDQLCEDARNSWVVNPTPRKFTTREIQ